MTPHYLVTAAAGKTGGETIRALVATDAGVGVRGMVRRDDERADQLRALGVEVVVGDYLDLASLRVALQGVSGAYFTYPVAPGLVEATTMFAEAATLEGVATIVNMSQMVASEEGPSPASRSHWLAERVLDWAAPAAVHIRPTWFAEMPFMLSLASIVDDGQFVFPWGREAQSPVSISDIGRTVAAILGDPSSHWGRTYVLTGADRVTPAEIAESIGEAMGQSVTYEDMEFETWGAILGAFGLPANLIEHLGHACEQQRNGVFDRSTSDIEAVTGTAPTPYHDVVAASVARIPEMTRDAEATLARLLAG